ncbi:hypothetical protein BH20ACT17_BH20ACT17_04020 [soil metagenome]
MPRRYRFTDVRLAFSGRPHAVRAGLHRRRRLNRHEYPPATAELDANTLGPGWTAYAPLDPPPMQR